MGRAGGLLTGDPGHGEVAGSGGRQAGEIGLKAGHFPRRDIVKSLYRIAHDR
jgi:hypothetical protein